MLQILTPSGWSDFSGIQKKENRSVVHLNGLTCTPDHLIKQGDNFIPAKNMNHKQTNFVCDVYDIIGVEKNNEYYTNGIISHNCDFRSSASALIDTKVLERLVTQSPIEELNDGDLKIYKYPDENHQYAITVDTSRGLGGDYHAFSVIDVTSKPYEVVASYKNNKLSPLLYPSVIYNVGMKYNEAVVLIEINDIGEQTANILYNDLEYENVLMTVVEKTRQIIGYGTGSKLGVRTSTAVKAVGCSTIKTMIEKNQIIINDYDTVNEFGTFIPKGKSYEADKGCHDDMVMTLVLFAWLTTQSYFKEITDSNLREKLIEGMNDRAFESLTPFGIIDNEFGEFGADLDHAKDLHDFDMLDYGEPLPEGFGTF